MMDTELKPKNPETLSSFNAILDEYNRVFDKNLQFTDRYRSNIDLWVNEETTADGYGIYTIREDGESIEMDNIYYYEPNAYDIFNKIEEIGGYGDFCVYTDMDNFSDLEYHMMEELETNYQNWLDEQYEEE
jgi:hypothetical protein